MNVETIRVKVLKSGDFNNVELEASATLTDGEKVEEKAKELADKLRNEACGQLSKICRFDDQKPERIMSLANQMACDVIKSGNGGCCLIEGGGVKGVLVDARAFLALIALTGSDWNEESIPNYDRALSSSEQYYKELDTLTSDIPF